MVFFVTSVNRQIGHRPKVLTFQVCLDVSCVSKCNHLVVCRDPQANDEIKPIIIDDEIKPIVINEAPEEESKDGRPALVPKLKLAS